MNDEEKVELENAEQEQQQSVSLTKEEQSISQPVYQENQPKMSGTGTGYTPDSMQNPYGPPYVDPNQPYGQNPPYGQNQPYGQNPPYVNPNQPYGQNQPYVNPNQPYGQNQPYSPNQPYGSNQAYGPNNQKPETSGLAIASFILGIVSVLLFCTCFNIVTAVIAIVLGIVHLATKKKDKGLAIAGLVCSVISIIMTVVYFVLLVQSPGAKANSNFDPKSFMESEDQSYPFLDDDF